MRTFALYKLPYAKEITEIITSDDNDVEEIYSYAKLSEKQGFVIAPFALSNDCPIVLIRPNTIRHYDIADFLRGKPLEQGILAKENPYNDESLPDEKQQKQHYAEESSRFNMPNFQDKKVFFQANSTERNLGSTDDLRPESQQNESQSKADEQRNNNRLTDLENSSMLRTTNKEQPCNEFTDGNPTEERIVLEDNHQKGYALDFANFHSHICSDKFTKLVLARKATYKTHEPISPLTLFARACHYYHRMFVALVSSAKSGIWLTATPEILLEGHENQWRTMALAGTMKLEGEQMSLDTPPTPNSKIANANLIWSLKNRAEQRIVATYVTQCLEQFTSDFSEDGPFSTRAGNLVHLRSDFKFTLKSKQSIGQLLEALHPTPAVCGLPKRKACQFILENEMSPRRYYSGFMGPLGINGDTHLFVTLRCMEINNNYYNLYAGGGLLKESEEEKEWQETEMKMETMKQCLQTRKI